MTAPQGLIAVPIPSLPPTGYLAPKLNLAAFTCPYCKAFAQQDWTKICVVFAHGSLNPYWKIAVCVACNAGSVWFQEVMVYPVSQPTEEPNPDMPADVQTDFREAAAIVNRSPRGAAALLRLCIQKLCVELGQPGKNINEDIGSLFKKGLDERVRQALDVVRVVGNQAVHPGEINFQDTPEIARQLFALVNLIVDVMISQPKHISAIYSSLPQPQLDSIAKRDASGTT